MNTDKCPECGARKQGQFKFACGSWSEILISKKHQSDRCKFRKERVAHNKTREALRGLIAFAQHDEDCEWFDNDQVCSCGCTAALETARKALEGQE